MLTQKGVRRKLSLRIGFVSFLGQITMKKAINPRKSRGMRLARSLPIFILEGEQR
jgi:hypothetical protein